MSKTKSNFPVAAGGGGAGTGSISSSLAQAVPTDNTVIAIAAVPSRIAQFTVICSPLLLAAELTRPGVTLAPAQTICRNDGY